MAGPFKDIFARLRKKPSQPDQEIEIRLNRLAELRDRALADMGDFGNHYDAASVIPPLPMEEAGPAPATQAEAPAAIDMSDLGPVVLLRRERELGVDWSDARSWFGGLPKLGGAPWPRGADGVPMHFVAQIRLADLAATHPGVPLPHSGSLAFFVQSGAVIHVPDDAQDFTPPPADLPPAYTEDGYPFDTPSILSRPTFPYWPIDFLPIDLPPRLRDTNNEELHDEICEALDEGVTAHVPRRQYALGTKTLTETYGVAPLPVWWDGAGHFIATLKKALLDAPRRGEQLAKVLGEGREYLAKLERSPEAGLEEIERQRRSIDLQEKKIAQFQAQLTQAPALQDALEGFAAGRAPWTPLTEEECAVLTDALHAARREYHEITSYHVPFDVNQLTALSLRKMMTGGEEAIAAMPDDALRAINTHYRLPSQGLQQMFGLGSSIQTVIYDNADKVLLLQLVYDDMMEWRWGDMGAFTFWITPEDLAASRFDRVEFAFECS